MSHFRFMNARLPDPAYTKAAIVERLDMHLRKLKAVKKGQIRPLKTDGEIDELKWLDQLDDVRLSMNDRHKIDRRATVISQRHAAATGLSHLKAEDTKKLDVLRHGVRLSLVASEHQADEVASALHEEFPWMGPATETLWHAMRRSVRAGEPGLCVPPMLLDGPPGIGKSAWARALGELIGSPTMVYEATNENASFGLVGSQRGWGNANPGRLISSVLQHRFGNPVVVIDELDKSGRVTSIKGQTYALTDALLPLLEPSSAKGWTCPYFEVKFDMSFVIWVLTSNDHRRLPEPLLSRCPPIRLRELAINDLIIFAQRQGLRRGLSVMAVEVIVEALRRGAQPGHMSLRTVGRMIDKAVSLQNRGSFLH